MHLDQPSRAEDGDGRVAKSRMHRWGPRTRHRVQAQLRLLRWEHASPGRVGFAVGVGVMLGCSPFLGFHVLLALVLARVLRLNRIAILLGVQISVPPLTPLVLFATAQVGAFVQRGQWLPLHLAGFRLPAARLLASLFLDMLVGGALVGAVLALVLGSLSAVALGWRKPTQLGLGNGPAPEPVLPPG